MEPTKTPKRVRRKSPPPGLPPMMILMRCMGVVFVTPYTLTLEDDRLRV